MTRGKGAPATRDGIWGAALAAYHAGDARRAVLSCDMLLARDPDDFPALLLAGRVLRRAGATATAIQYLQRAAELQPAEAAAHAELAKACLAAPDAQRALAALAQCEAAGGAGVELYYNRALARSMLGDYAQAVADCDRVLAIDPRHLDALNNRATAHARLGRTVEAAAGLDAALAFAPRNLRLRGNRGLVACQARDFEMARHHFDAALAIDPADPGALINRGLAEMFAGSPDRALTWFDAALGGPGAAADAQSWRAGALLAADRRAEALNALRDGVARLPDNALARWHLSLTELLLGDFEAGWRNYEARFDSVLAQQRRDFGSPRWNGGPDSGLAGKRLFVPAEQGMGDIIQFARYAPLLAARGARVLLEAPQALLPVLASLAGIEALIPYGDAVPEHELHCPLLSLPLAFGTTAQTIPAAPAYLASPVERRVRFAPTAIDGLRVGLAWSGNAANPRDADRSIPLADFARILVPGATYVSLQRELRASDRAALAAQAGLTHHGEALADFGDTAALIESVDLVVSVDTAVAHLAGALGKPVWILISRVPDWRWQLDRDDSPWYPGARLFRQCAFGGDWSELIERVRVALSDWLDSRHAERSA
ncbi:MAG: tetratricopeptide repeat protein [Burkholderiales bacterium]